jgi:hypothetical protein
MALAWKAGWVQALRGSNPLSSAHEQGAPKGAFCVCARKLKVVDLGGAPATVPLSSAHEQGAPKGAFCVCARKLKVVDLGAERRFLNSATVVRSEVAPEIQQRSSDGSPILRYHSTHI